MIDGVLMREIESGYRKVSGLRNRSQYKIFYTPIQTAPVLALGINPAGEPAEIMPDGMRDRLNPNTRHAASAKYYENGESDLVDCNWRENRITELLEDILSCNREGLRQRVVKTNLAFRRAPRGAIKKLHGMSMAQAMDEAIPFLTKIIKAARPKLIVLGGVKMDDFTSRYCRHVDVMAEPEREPDVRQIVYYPALVRLQSGGSKVLAVQVAHASQFGWTYRRYDVARRIRELRAL